MEFVMIERTNVLQIAMPFSVGGLEELKYFQPVSNLMTVQQTGVLGIWGILTSHAELASQLVFDLRFASKIGSQLLESSVQSAQH